MAEVVGRMLQKGQPIGYFTDDANSDTPPTDQPANLTGRVEFRDDRLSTAEGGTVDLADGGILEMFSDPTAAKARLASLRPAATTSATEYDYNEGPVVLRLSSRFSQEQADAYDRALAGSVS